MTLREARQLVKDRAPSKYKKASLRLLEKMIGGLYSKTTPERDVHGVTLKKSVGTLCAHAMVQERQLTNALHFLSDVVTVVSRKRGNIFYQMNFDSLNSLPDWKKTDAERRRERTAKRVKNARVKRQQNRDSRTSALASYIAVAVASGMPAPWLQAQ
jgi:hypothetical protein